MIIMIVQDEGPLLQNYSTPFPVSSPSCDFQLVFNRKIFKRPCIRGDTTTFLNIHYWTVPLHRLGMPIP